MDVILKLKQLQQQRNWSDYRLARESSLSESTIANIYKRNTMPTIATLESICKGFGITLAQFFAEDDLIEMSPSLKELVTAWIPLTPAQKDTVLTVAKSYLPESE